MCVVRAYNSPPSSSLPHTSPSTRAPSYSHTRCSKCLLNSSSKTKAYKSLHFSFRTMAVCNSRELNQPHHHCYHPPELQTSSKVLGGCSDLQIISSLPHFQGPFPATHSTNSNTPATFYYVHLMLTTNRIVIMTSDPPPPLLAA